MAKHPGRILVKIKKIIVHVNIHSNKMIGCLKKNKINKTPHTILLSKDAITSIKDSFFLLNILTSGHTK